MTSDEAKKLGLFSCSAVVAGNMMGSGIALLPSNLAKIGSIAIWGWVVASAGALALAFVYAKLGTTDPQEGGPIAYSGEVAPILGYQAGLLYFHAGWIGNLAIAITGVDYLSVFFPVLTQAIPAGISAIVIIWVFTALNLLGSHWIGRLVSVGVIALLIPVVLTGTVGWSFFDGQTFIQNWNVGHSSNSHAILAAVVLCIWSFIGVESASVNAGLVENPRRNIPLATIIGTSVASLVYVASSTAISGMFPAAQVAKSGAPFALATGHMFGGWTQPIVSAVTAFACLASLGSWIMMIAQAAARAAKDGTLPAVFGKKNKNGVPAKGIVLTSTFLTALMLVLMVGSKGTNTQDIFGEIVSITVLFTVIPYFYSALRLIKMACGARKRAVFQIVVSIVASGFCFTALAGAEHTTLISALVIILGTFIFYVTKDRTEFEKRQHALQRGNDESSSG